MEFENKNELEVNRKLLESYLFMKGYDGESIDSLCKLFKCGRNAIKKTINKLNDIYKANDNSFRIMITGEKIRMTVEENISLSLLEIIPNDTKVVLSKSLIETLTIIAYNQPVTKSQINNIRGISSDYVVNKLELLNLIESKKTSHTPGNPKLWTTTDDFLELFNLRSLAKLPNRLKYGKNKNTKIIE